MTEGHLDSTVLQTLFFFPQVILFSFPYPQKFHKGKKIGTVFFLSSPQPILRIGWSVDILLTEKGIIF